MKKITVLGLLFTLLFSSLPSNVMAQENTNNLCDHHKQHSADCGYIQDEGDDSCNFICEICGEANDSEPKVVSKFNWLDENNLIYQNGQWHLNLPKPSNNKLMSKEELLKQLPSHIVLTWTSDGKKGQSATSLTWDIEGYPAVDENNNQYTARATLPDYNYSVKVYISLLSGISLEELRKHEVQDTLSPVGTRINVFDYWLSDDEKERFIPDHAELKPSGEEDHDQDLSNDQKYKSFGINKGHAFKFIGHGGDWQGYNRWTGASPDGVAQGVNPYTGIVNNVLKDGFPVLSSFPKDFTWADWNNGIYDTNDEIGSLNYLFDPTLTHTGKASFSNVNNLLQVDEKGYYYFDASKNYARLDEKNGRFVLYDTPAFYRSNTNDPNLGQFFPFQTEQQAASYFLDNNNDGVLEYNEDINPSSDKANHYFGMTMETRFVHKNGGKNFKDEAITYEFTGDDDVWVFIDDVLVADLGGIHDKAKFHIDFSNGNIVVNDEKKSTLKEQFEQAGKLNAKKFNGNTFADNTYHTLKFFYLERGNHESNMSLRYNLLPIPESELIKVNQMGERISGVDFTMYTADEKYNVKEKIFTGTTDHDGYMYLRDDLGVPMTFAQLYDEYGSEYYVLQENNPAPGYRKTEDVHLHYKIYNKEKNIGVIETDEKNMLRTGAYAQAKVMAIAPNIISYGRINNVQEVDKVDLMTKDPESFLMFAVIFKKSSQDNNWYPVSGDALSGWKVAKRNDWSAVLDVARKNPYLFHLETSGAYQAEIDNLPGNVEEYHSFLKQYGKQSEAKYYVAYYYSEAKDLNSVDANNTYQVLNQITQSNDLKDFLREFSCKLFVPNIKNTLLVHKKDQKYDALNGATFALYQAADLNVNDDGTYTVKKDAKPYDEATTTNLTNMEAGIIFPSAGKNLDTGHYYLVETKAPDGYEKHPKAIEVIVDNSGVYADAGNKNDNIFVARSPGMIVRSMLQFAANDHVNSTLHDIKAQLLTAPTYEGENTKWTSWNEHPASVNELHLQYEENDPILDYGLIDSEKLEHEFLALVTDTGFSKLEIRQCRDHDDGLVASETKKDLGDSNLSRFYSGLTTVIVRDDLVGGSGELAITKTVAGDLGDQNKDFNFMITLDQKLNGKYGQLEFVDGISKFSLKHGQTVLAMGLPIGTNYTVVEQEANKDGYVTISTNEKGTIAKDKQIVAFVNTKDPIVPEVDKGSLSISKTVTGNKGDQQKDWNFTVTLNDSSINGQYGDLTFKDGIASFTLKHGQVKTALSLPVGVSYQVVEKEANLDAYITTMHNDKGEIEKNTTKLTSFVNDKNTTSPIPEIEEEPQDPQNQSENPGTGDGTNVALYASVLLISVLAIIGIIVLNKKKK